MAIITLSRQYGSGGDEIAARVADLLGYQEFDRRMITQAAHDVGLSDQEIIDYSEDNHRIRSFLDRLFGREQIMPKTRVWKEDSLGYQVMEEFSMSETTALSLVQNSIESAYRAGNMVIVGRGGQVILKDRTGVLHIRVEAPMEDRIQRVKQELKRSENDYHAGVDQRRQAQDLIEQRDLASGDYMRRFYQVDWSDPLLYHMVLNTGKIAIEQAALLVVREVRMLEQVIYL